MNRRILSSSLSARVIDYLRESGRSQSQIARMLHVSEGFVSLVKSKERSLTIEHLELIAAALSVPLGALLLAATAIAPKDQKNKQLYSLSRELLEQAAAARESIIGAVENGTRRKPKRRPPRRLAKQA